MSLSLKMVLITGASSGIGRACAIQAAQLGANLILIARRADELKACAKACESHGVKTQSIILDVSDRAAVTANLSELSVDILINNAGLAAGFDSVQNANLDDFDHMIDINLKGMLYVTKALLPGMLQRNSGHIINIGSIAGVEVYPNGAVYCASKHAVNAFSRGLKMDLNTANLRVSCINPGMVESEFSLVRFEGDVNRAKAVYQGMQPLSPDDVADTVMYVATRPPHVNISEILMMPTDQASSTLVHRQN